VPPRIALAYRLVPFQPFDATIVSGDLGQSRKVAAPAGPPLKFEWHWQQGTTPWSQILADPARLFFEIGFANLRLEVRGWNVGIRFQRVQLRVSNFAF
jgi:hypothetical protein